MDGRGFFLGIIAAVVLFLLWKKEQVAAATVGASMFSSTGLSPAPSTTGGCAGCGGPSAAAAPAYQGVLMGPDGQISPGTPPLNASLGSGSFYAPSGPTPDTGFTSYPSAPAPIFNTAAPVMVGPFVGTVTPSSPTTPANQVPVRSVQTVGSYSTIGGFQQRYNLAGIPRIAAEPYLQ